MKLNDIKPAAGSKPTRKRLDGELADLRTARDGADKVRTAASQLAHDS